MSETTTWLKSLLPFVVMCFGGFMALLDIQIVVSSLQYIGGGLTRARFSICLFSVGEIRGRHSG